MVLSTKGHLGSKKVSNFVPKITGKSRYPEKITKRHFLYPPEYLVQHHLCFIEGVSLPELLLAFGGREGVFSGKKSA